MGVYDKKQNKDKLTVARVTAFLKGSTKNKFFKELYNSPGKTESQLVSEIITKYYL